jgi:hypothetical protein
MSAAHPATLVTPAADTGDAWAFLLGRFTFVGVARLDRGSAPLIHHLRSADSGPAPTSSSSTET